MAEHARFAYVQARLQARNGDRPTDATWRMLGASKSLGHYLESARQTGLSPWVTHLSAGSDVHTIEAELRGDWHTLTASVATWVPREWRAAVLWTGDLADLPFGERTAGEATLTDWTRKFRTLWPPCDKRDAHVLDAMIAAFAPPEGEPDSDRDRERRRAKLKRVFRLSAQRAPAAFAFLGLMALDLMQLRAGLVQRSLFPELLEG